MPFAEHLYDILSSTRRHLFVVEPKGFHAVQIFGVNQWRRGEATESSYGYSKVGVKTVIK